MSDEIGKELSDGYIEIRSRTNLQSHDIEEQNRTLFLKDDICSIFYDYFRILLGRPKVGQEIEWLEKEIK